MVTQLSRLKYEYLIENFPEEFSQRNTQLSNHQHPFGNIEVSFTYGFFDF